MAENKNQPPIKSTPTARPSAAKPTTAPTRPAAATRPTPTTARPTTPVKPAPTVKPVTPAAKAAAPAAKPVAKSTETAKPAPTAARPATATSTAKPATPAARTTIPAAKPAAKPAPTVKPVTPAAKAAAPAAKPATAEPTTAPAKPAATAKEKPSSIEKDKSVKPKKEAAASRAVTEKPTKAEKVKPAKAEKAKDKKQDKGQEGKGSPRRVAAAKNGGAAAATKKHPLSTKTKLLIIGVAAALAIVILVAIILVSCNTGKESGGNIYTGSSDNYLLGSRPSDNAFVTDADISEGSFVNKYKNRTKVGYNAEYIGTTARKIPTETSDEGLVKSGKISAYPKYGSGTNYDAEQRQAVINESWALTTINTQVGSDGKPKNTYNKMDADGNLYLNGEPTGKKLYKHTSAVGMYYGNVSDSEPAIIKKLTYAPRANGTSYNVTGVYAPAGEVIKIEVSEADMKATGAIEVMIGQALYNHKANNIWAARGINRMPVILNTWVINAANCTYDSERHVYTGYVGSFYGGPIYVYNRPVQFSITISGGVRYAHYILGYTTPEDYAENLKSSAPYFDLEVRENGVLHSGPKSSVSAAVLSYDNIYKAAELWEKISIVSTRRNRQGIVFIYDPFVAAGAAVAFPGQMSVNCPTGWMSGSLNYDAFVRSGSWGNVHEYNHNFQGYGCGGGADGEVTNNALSLVEYSLFTEISAARQIGSYGGSGLSDWNCYTSATWALNRVKTGAITSTNGLAVYATLLHNLGQEAFMNASSGRDLAYFTKWGEVTHQNMSYFTSLIDKYSSADYSSLAKTQKDYPMFVPVSSVYQTGRSYMYDKEKRYITTMQPYVIKYGETIDVDMRPYTVQDGMYQYGSVVIPEGFSFTVKSVTTPQYGSLVKKEDNVYTYTPVANQLRSGKMVVTLSITKNDGAFTVDDVDLVLEFKQSHEKNKTMLERTIYTYDAQTMPESSTAAFESGFSGATSKETVDNVNPTQNGNTEIWSKTALPANTYYEIKGKLFINENGKYRIALRGRWDCALYTAVNSDKDYKLSATIKTTESHANFYLSDPETYFDAEYKAGDWVYFKAIVKSENKGGKNAYIGLGSGQFIPPQGTIDNDGNLIDGNGNIIEDPRETINVTYANAYRATYEFVDNSFKSDYFFLRDYNYTYRSPDVEYHNVEQSIVEHNFVPWSEQYKIENLFDGNPNTTAHSAQHRDGKPETSVNANNPFKISVKLDKPVTANAFIVYARNDSANKTGLPQNFTLEFRDEKDGKVVATKTFTNASHASGADLEVALGEYITFGYYTLTVTKSENDYFVASSMGFATRRALVSGTVMEADNVMFKYDGNWKINAGFYTFGHVYEGSSGATIKFTFTGSAFGVFAYKGAEYGGMEVFIDGKSVGKVDLQGAGAGSQLVFLSDDLSKDCKHTVEIRCNNGVADIDHIVLWK
ncbi:MAG: M60 family metallopeptidase [Clostridiales bacterium]|nr:M60 family metallopeptidase [Clostridiales bacterium]